jgi:hypothetical protein
VRWCGERGGKWGEGLGGRPRGPVPFRAPGDDALGPQLADETDEITAKLDAGHQLAFLQAEEVHGMDAEDVGSSPLLSLADARYLIARHGRVEAAGVTVGQNTVGDLNARISPGGDGTPGPELGIVGVAMRRRAGSEA